MATRKTPSGGRKPDKPWSDALRRAVNRYGQDNAGEKTKYLDLMADRTVQEGAAGNMTAVAEIGNRLDGKPVAPVEVSTAYGPITIIHVDAGPRPGDEAIDVTPKPKSIEASKE